MASPSGPLIVAGLAPDPKETDIRTLLDEIKQVVQLARLDVEPRPQLILGEPRPHDPLPPSYQIGNDLVDLLARLADEFHQGIIRSTLPEIWSLMIRKVPYQPSALPEQVRKYLECCDPGFSCNEAWGEGWHEASYFEVCHPKKTERTLTLVVSHRGIHAEPGALNFVAWDYSFSTSDENDPRAATTKSKAVVEHLCVCLTAWEKLLIERWKGASYSTTPSNIGADKKGTKRSQGGAPIMKLEEWEIHALKKRWNMEKQKTKYGHGGAHLVAKVVLKDDYDKDPKSAAKKVRALFARLKVPTNLKALLHARFPDDPTYRE